MLKRSLFCDCLLTVCVLIDVSFDFVVYQLVWRRRFVQMEVLETQNILVTISGKKNKIRVYYLSWLKSKILKNEGVHIMQEHYEKFF